MKPRIGHAAFHPHYNIHPTKLPMLHAVPRLVRRGGATGNLYTHIIAATDEEYAAVIRFLFNRRARKLAKRAGGTPVSRRKGK